MNNELLEHKVNLNEKRLNNHADRIDKLEQNDARKEIQIENLCRSIEGLTHTLKWGFGFILTAVVGFFIYAIQNHIFK
ncbi:hemolysin XhlA family protein [Clostridium perfringens]|uniref:Haemolysin XhlA n=1 Tax=Clostridium perfringens E str. JGS1987 TaxID=451755 RepID=B1BPS2_CLOPF|nr:hemolysin XhlA family protein [Clostridium perfringens]EDT16316.1 conserved hypothetical protein [Clostridium perfringens E str. JGS1987]MDK0669359.1 hemolysin XhlA family protein [Clostridium perfringens]MDT7986918.1 hemolysin XhlA family protein [Clostridium perfringens]WVM59985.1 hemolysin XhlA family protein [Clostridium perfringens]